MYPSIYPDIKNLFLFQKNRFLGSDLKSYLGIQYGTFLLRKKKIVLLYVRRVVLVPFSEKITPLASPNDLPPIPIPTQKMAARSSRVIWMAAAGRWQWQCQGVGGGASVDVGGGGGSGGGGGGSGGRRGERRSLCLARFGVGPLTHRLALRACGPGWQGGDSSNHFAFLVLGSGRWRVGLRCACVPGQRWAGVSGARGRIHGRLRWQRCWQGGEQQRLLSSLASGLDR